MGVRRCPLFRNPESLSMGKGIGYCDMDGNSTTCDGDVRYCEKPDALARYLRQKIDSHKKNQPSNSDL